MDEYIGNSNRSKQEKNNNQKLEKVVHGIVHKKKKSGFNRVTESILSEDAGNVKNFILMDVLIPSLKRTISDIVTNGIEILLYGESRPSRDRDRRDSVSYRRYYEDRPKYSEAVRSRNVYDYEDIVIASRGEAERVLDRLYDSVETYGAVSVGDLYDLVGMTGSFTNYKYGWTDLRPAKIERVRDGYWIKLPKAVALD